MIKPVGQNVWSWYGLQQRNQAADGTNPIDPENPASSGNGSISGINPATSTAGKSEQAGPTENDGDNAPSAGLADKPHANNASPLLSHKKDRDGGVANIGDLGEKTAKRLGLEECKTCENRKYQDGSDDPGVSFKAPTKVAPQEAAMAVMAHEEQHVTHEQARAREEGRKVVSQSVQLHTAVCPECGRIYISGGTTTTRTAAQTDAKQFDPDQFKSSSEDDKPSIDVLI